MAMLEGNPYFTSSLSMTSKSSEDISVSFSSLKLAQVMNLKISLTNVAMGRAILSIKITWISQVEMGLCLKL